MSQQGSLSDKDVHPDAAGLSNAGSAALIIRHPRSAYKPSLDGDIPMIKKTLLLMLTAAFIVAIAGCNTLHGAGQDIEAVGESLQEAAE